jgi:hypothetical protein
MFSWLIIVVLPNPPDRKGHKKQNKRHQGGGRYSGLKSFICLMQTFKNKMHDGSYIISDGSDREAFDRLLQLQLQAGSMVHLAQEIAILTFKIDFDTRSQQLRGARQFALKIVLPSLGGGAGPYRGRQPTSQETRKSGQIWQRLFAERIETIIQQFIISAGRAKAIKAFSGACLEFRRESCQLLQQTAICCQAFALLHRIHEKRQFGLDPAD